MKPNTKTCLICGDTVIVSENAPEIVTCTKDMCIVIVENNIGLHYEPGPNIYNYSHSSISLPRRL